MQRLLDLKRQYMMAAANEDTYEQEEIVVKPSDPPELHDNAMDSEEERMHQRLQNELDSGYAALTPE